MVKPWGVLGGVLVLGLGLGLGLDEVVGCGEGVNTLMLTFNHPPTGCQEKLRDNASAKHMFVVVDNS